MRQKIQLCVSVAAMAALSACAAAPPSAPSFAAMPAQGQSFEQFNRNDATCRDFASSRVNTPSIQQQQNNQVGTAVAGTALGAAAGALLGAASGHAAGGAAIGAGLGLLGGSSVAANQTQGGAYSAQQSYDTAYAQCMTAKGEQVPPPYGGYYAQPAYPAGPGPGPGYGGPPGPPPGPPPGY